MNLKMWMSTVALSAVAVAFFAVAPASAQCNDLLAQSNSDARDPANARFAQDARTRPMPGSQNATPLTPGSPRTTLAIRTAAGSRRPTRTRATPLTPGSPRTTRAIRTAAGLRRPTRTRATRPMRGSPRTTRVTRTAAGSRRRTRTRATLPMPGSRKTTSAIRTTAASPKRALISVTRTTVGSPRAPAYTVIRINATRTMTVCLKRAAARIHRRSSKAKFRGSLMRTVKEALGSV